MNLNGETTGIELKSATTERKRRGGRGSKRARNLEANVIKKDLNVLGKDSTLALDESMKKSPATHGARKMNTLASEILNATTSGKLVLFAIPKADRVEHGPVMRGFIEVKPEDEPKPFKVNVAAWLKIGRTSGTEYLSLKVGNNTPEEPEEYTVGPFYGRLFRQVDGKRTRYFGFIEDSEKTGEDENGQGTYETHWQIRVSAKPAISNDQKTHYISGSVMPAQQQESAADDEGDSGLPF